MKKFLFMSVAFIAAIACFFIAACGGKSSEPVVITADDANFVYEDKTLKDYMSFLQQNGELDYKVSNGMVTEINGVAQTTNSYWLLYTDDAENANEAWGTFEHEGKSYASANLGVEELPVKKGCAYIWVYQTF